MASKASSDGMPDARSSMARSIKSSPLSKWGARLRVKSSRRLKPPAHKRCEPMAEVGRVGGRGVFAGGGFRKGGKGLVDEGSAEIVFGVEVEVLLKGVELAGF
jgi:hypothetical protein